MKASGHQPQGGNEPAIRTPAMMAVPMVRSRGPAWLAEVARSGVATSNLASVLTSVLTSVLAGSGAIMGG